MEFKLKQADYIGELYIFLCTNIPPLPSWCKGPYFTVFFTDLQLHTFHFTFQVYTRKHYRFLVGLKGDLVSVSMVQG